MTASTCPCCSPPWAFDFLSTSIFTVVKLNPLTGAPVWARDHGANCFGSATDASGNVYTCGDPEPLSGNTIRRYDTNGKLTLSISTPQSLYGIAVDGSGNIYATGARSGSVTTYAFDSSGGTLATFDHGNDTYCLALLNGTIVIGGAWVLGSTANGCGIINFRVLDTGLSVQWSGSTTASVQSTTSAFTLSEILQFNFTNVVGIDSSGNIFTGQAIRGPLGGGTGGQSPQKSLVIVTGTPTAGSISLKVTTGSGSFVTAPIAWNNLGSAATALNATASGISFVNPGAGYTDGFPGLLIAANIPAGGGGPGSTPQPPFTLSVNSQSLTGATVQCFDIYKGLQTNAAGGGTEWTSSTVFTSAVFTMPTNEPGDSTVNGFGAVICGPTDSGGNRYDNIYFPSLLVSAVVGTTVNKYGPSAFGPGGLLVAPLWTFTWGSVLAATGPGSTLSNALAVTGSVAVNQVALDGSGNVFACGLRARL